MVVTRRPTSPRAAVQVAVIVALILTVIMPHARSAAALAARRARAIERGYVQPTARGTSHVLVAAPVAKPVAIVARAMNRHRELDAASGHRSHSLRLAALAAKPGISDVLFEDSLALNRRACGAKHNVSKGAVCPVPDSWEVLSDVPLDPLVSKGPWVPSRRASPRRTWASLDELPDELSRPPSSGPRTSSYLTEPPATRSAATQTDAESKEREESKERATAAGFVVSVSGDQTKEIK